MRSLQRLTVSITKNCRAEGTRRSENMKAIILLAVLAVAVASPEAPVDRRYLPPSAAGGHRHGGSQGFRGATRATFANRNNGGPSPQYGPPSFQSGAPISGAGADPLAEPASYQFNYKVEDAEAGLDFGHQEEREGDDTKGEYRVLLPDGRNMIVTYTADLGGYHPEIRFEEAKGGYNRGPNGSNNGY